MIAGSTCMLLGERFAIPSGRRSIKLYGSSFAVYTQIVGLTFVGGALNPIVDLICKRLDERFEIPKISQPDYARQSQRNPIGTNRSCRPGSRLTHLCSRTHVNGLERTQDEEKDIQKGNAYVYHTWLYRSSAVGSMFVTLHQCGVYYATCIRVSSL
jgi:hypothetical protein